MLGIILILSWLATATCQAPTPPTMPLFTLPPNFTYPNGTCGTQANGYSCSKTNISGQTCQCDLPCLERRPIDCCSDFVMCQTLCVNVGGCNSTVVPGQECQCDRLCDTDGRQDCCPDKDDVCGVYVPPTVTIVVRDCNVLGCGNASTNCSCAADCQQPLALLKCCDNFPVVCPNLATTMMVTTAPITTTPPPNQNCTEAAIRGACEVTTPGYACYCNADCARTNSCCDSFASSSCNIPKKPTQNCTALGAQNKCVFNSAASCQCIPSCEFAIGDSACCPDYNSSACVPTTGTVPPTTTPQTLCSVVGCEFNDPQAPCRCNLECMSNNDCCSDYSTSCTRSLPSRPWCGDRAPADQCRFIPARENATLQCQCDTNCYLFSGKFPALS